MRLCVRLCMLLAFVAWQGAAWACQVCVVGSEKTLAYQEAFDALSQELVRGGMARAELEFMTVAELANNAADLQEARLLITLGADALRQVRLRGHKVPVLAGLIPRLSFERLLNESSRRGTSPVSALYLDQPLQRQIELLRLAFPQVRRVGVLWGPESIGQQALLSSLLQARGLEIREGFYSDTESLSKALQSALQEADVLLQVADASVYNPNTVSNILLSSYRAKVPVQAFSPSYVKAGALLSLHSTAAQAGVQMAGMAQQYLYNNTVPPSLYPYDFTITVNDYVARSLELTLDARTLGERVRRLEKRP